jgi:hypothetical protein
VTVNERQSGPPAIAGRGAEAGLLAGLVALHISAHPEGVTEGRPALHQEILMHIISIFIRLSWSTKQEA